MDGGEDGLGSVLLLGLRIDRVTFDAGVGWARFKYARLRQPILDLQALDAAEFVDIGRDQCFAQRSGMRGGSRRCGAA